MALACQTRLPVALPRIPHGSIHRTIRTFRRIGKDAVALRNIAQKWTMPVYDWKGALNRFAIIYENRLPAS